MRLALLAALTAVLMGCITPPSPSQRLADCAFEMNHATRFGRMDLAAEQVGPTAREDFVRRHSGWGQSIRVVDVELTSIRFIGFIDRGHADVSLRVSWQHASEAELRETQLSQRWQDDGGKWLMMSEQRVSGPAGLFNDPVVDERKAPEEPGVTDPTPKRSSYFRTRVIAGD
jgi:hypothetical protein